MEQLPPTIHESWHVHLQPLFDDPKMLMIKNEILPKCSFYPEKANIFNVFKMPISAIKVVILGQDPYPNGEAIGYAFSVDEYKPASASLRVIQKELTYSEAPMHPDVSIMIKSWKPLAHWRQQGVFLLNTALTVQKDDAGSHIGYWKWFTRQVIEIIANNTSGVVWLLWGSHAKAYKEFIQPKIEGIPLDAVLPDSNFHFVFEANHPAAESYPDSKYKFTGCNHFNLVNKALSLQNKSIIKW